MISENCSTCKWSTVVGLHKETNTEVVECRRYPPAVFPFPDQRTGQMQKISFFPLVNSSMDCGEWQIAILTS